jgi:hypothetical protein
MILVFKENWIYFSTKKLLEHFLDPNYLDYIRCLKSTLPNWNREKYPNYYCIIAE